MAEYKDGRVARNGDKVTNTETGDSGVLYDLDEKGVGRISRLAPDDPQISVGTCLVLEPKMPPPPEKPAPTEEAKPASVTPVNTPVTPNPLTSPAQPQK